MQMQSWANGDKPTTKQTGGATSSQPRINKYNPLPALDKKVSRKNIITAGEKPTGTLSSVAHNENTETDCGDGSGGGGSDKIHRGGVEIVLLAGGVNPSSRAMPQFKQTSTSVVHMGKQQRAVTRQNPKDVQKSLPRLQGGKKVEKLGKIPKELKDKVVEDGRMESERHGLGRKQGQAVTRGVSPGEGENPPAGSPGWKWYSRSAAGFSDGKLKTNQDAVYVNARVKGHPSTGLFAVFDGHGSLGHKVSAFLKGALQGRLE